MKFLILGSGLMGSALAFDLARSKGVTGITLADSDFAAARRTAERIGSPLVKPVALDVEYQDNVVALMGEHDCAIGAVSYRFNYGLSLAAIETGVHFCDLGGNDDVVRRQRSLDPKARQKGVAIVPNCGLAPGMANVLAARGAELFESIDRIALRVGGLPQEPRPPFNYQLVFAVEGLVNEYSGFSATLRDSRIVQHETLTEVEAIDFPAPFGTLEAFHTSGGSSLLPEMFEGKVRHLDYKTIRYPGHCERFKTLLDLGFASSEPVVVGSNVLTSREMFSELLKRKLTGDGPDVVLLRVTVSGLRDGKETTLEFNLIDSFDKNDNITAMMRTTAYPTSVIAQMLTKGTIGTRGVMTPEQCVPLQPFLAELRARSIAVTETWK
ncbi:MAG TPA: saccharopine dehydrogenase C-terminal domain-containing protein [Bacteroidota bacterium]|nr:saccharopine dehydrogenase C-terminal domain-containing protein [Bacteroidota bacterium]